MFAEKTWRSGADFDTVTTSELADTCTYIIQGGDLTSGDVSEEELEDDYRNEDRKNLMRSIISQNLQSQFVHGLQQNASSSQYGDLFKLEEMQLRSEETFQDSSSDNEQLNTTSSLEDGNANL